MGRFLEDVAQFIQDTPDLESGIVSKTGHGFNVDDNEDCVRIFGETEQMYLDMAEENMRVTVKREELYGNIFEKKGDVPLVDNQKFIDWVATYREYPET